MNAYSNPRSEMDIYVKNGYRNRDHYLNELADREGVDADVVFALADLYGPGEDFDGLVTALQDIDSCEHFSNF